MNNDEIVVLFHSTDYLPVNSFKDYYPENNSFIIIFPILFHAYFSLDNNDVMDYFAWQGQTLIL